MEIKVKVMWIVGFWELNEAKTCDFSDAVLESYSKELKFSSKNIYIEAWSVESHL